MVIAAMPKIMPQLSANPQRIDLWLASLADQAGHDLQQAYWQLLNEAECYRAERFLREPDRQCFLLTRALVRTVLSRYTGVAAQALNFRQNDHGKPSLQWAADTVADTELSFNLSHCDDMIVLAVSHGRALGVDVENMVLKPAPINIAKRYFAAEECTNVNMLQGSQQDERFFAYWTLKEAYVKACGMGLSIPLDQFGFRLDAEQGVEMWLNPETQDRVAHWDYWQLRLASKYCLAICAEHLQGQPLPEISATRTIPLLADEKIAYELLRTSAPIGSVAHYSLLKQPGAGSINLLRST